MNERLLSSLEFVFKKITSGKSSVVYIDDESERDKLINGEINDEEDKHIATQYRRILLLSPTSKQMSVGKYFPPETQGEYLREEYGFETLIGKSYCTSVFYEKLTLKGKMADAYLKKIAPLYTDFPLENESLCTGFSANQKRASNEMGSKQEDMAVSKMQIGLFQMYIDFFSCLVSKFKNKCKDAKVPVNQEILNWLGLAVEMSQASLSASSYKALRTYVNNASSLEEFNSVDGKLPIVVRNHIIPLLIMNLTSVAMLDSFLPLFQFNEFSEFLKEKEDIDGYLERNIGFNGINTNAILNRFLAEKNIIAMFVEAISLYQTATSDNHNIISAINISLEILDNNSASPYARWLLCEAFFSQDEMVKNHVLSKSDFDKLKRKLRARKKKWLDSFSFYFQELLHCALIGGLGVAYNTLGKISDRENFVQLISNGREKKSVEWKKLLYREACKKEESFSYNWFGYEFEKEGISFSKMSLILEGLFYYHRAYLLDGNQYSCLKIGNFLAHEKNITLDVTHKFEDILGYPVEIEIRNKVISYKYKNEEKIINNEPSCLESMFAYYKRAAVINSVHRLTSSKAFLLITDRIFLNAKAPKEMKEEASKYVEYFIDDFLLDVDYENATISDCFDMHPYKQYQIDIFCLLAKEQEGRTLIKQAVLKNPTRKW